MSFRWLFQQSALLYKSLHLELYNEMPCLHHFWAGVCLPADDFTVTIHTIYSSTLTIIYPSTCRRNSKRGPWLAREVKWTKTRWIRPKLLLLKMMDPWPLKLNPFSSTGRKSTFLHKSVCVRWGGRWLCCIDLQGFLSACFVSILFVTVVIIWYSCMDKRVKAMKLYCKLLKHQSRW
jgi:hypothetical protein